MMYIRAWKGLYHMMTISERAQLINRIADKYELLTKSDHKELILRHLIMLQGKYPTISNIHQKCFQKEQ